MNMAEQEALYLTYHGKVQSYISARVQNREDARDLCSEVFHKVFYAWESYDEKKASVNTWIYFITRNIVIDYYRKGHPSEELPEDLADDTSLEDEFLREEQLEELAEALENLPANLTDIVVLHYYDRLPLTEIAGKLRISYGAVKLRHQKALALLRAALET